jgi:Spo7-like protein
VFLSIAHPPTCQMSEAGLDQLVKGSPPPNVSLPSVAAAAASTVDRAGSRSTSSPLDPTLHIPASPPQIYLNLLILEASLRSQYLTLRARYRQNTFVLTLLALWISFFFYCQFLRPREDGTGVGGSVYWLQDMLEKVALISGIVMGVLFRLTGQWERGIRWPNRWLRTTNRGLRGMNCKVVILKGPWWRELLSKLSFLLPISYFVETPGSNYQYIEYPPHERRLSQLQSKRRDAEKRHEVAEEDIASGGDYIKILLLPKHFTPEFRENWEMYRAEYWDIENQRRNELRARLRAKRKSIAKQQSPWLWWVPGHRPTPQQQITRAPSQSHRQHDSLSAPHNNTATTGGAISRASSVRHKRSDSSIKEREATPQQPSQPHSRSSSRSSIAAADADEQRLTERRWSTSTSSSIGGERSRRRKVGSESGDGRNSNRSSMVIDSGIAPARRGAKLGPGSSGSRPTTPTAADALSRPNKGGLSIMGSGSEGDSPGRRIKMEPMD